MANRVLMCRPDFYDIDYSINPWMDVKNKAKQELALEQWTNLRDLIIQCGGEIEYITPQKGLPDMVFTANGGLIYKDKAIVPSFARSERQGEEQHFREWLSQYYEVLQIQDFFFEGAGDALFAGDVLFAGYGIRSSKYAYDQIKEFLGIEKIVNCQLIDGHFYHLDTCFCPLDSYTAIYFPDAFTEETVDNIKSNIIAIPVSNEEALKFACNTVVIDRNVILSAGCPIILDILKGLEFNVFTCDISQFLLSGGGNKCMTLKL